MELTELLRFNRGCWRKIRSSQARNSEIDSVSMKEEKMAGYTRLQAFPRK